jgi:hypothetical protein
MVNLKLHIHSEPQPTSTPEFPNGCSLPCDLNEINGCSIGCYNTLHFENVSGFCTEKLCFERTSNETGNYPCGSDNDSNKCYWDLGGGTNKCSTTCTNEDLYELNDNNRSCILKECSVRTPNESLSNECGDDNCYLEGNTCVLNCYIYSKPINNVCVNCIDITADNESSCFGINGCYFESGKDRCVLEGCTKYNVIECSNIINCTVVNGICVEIKNGSINGSIAGNVIGGFTFSEF